MNQHKRRIDRLSEQIDFHLPTDDEIIVIKLVWPGQDFIRPIVRRGKMAGGGVRLCWPDDAAEVA